MGRRDRPVRLALKRGDLITVVIPGAYGKPRPAIVLQSDLFEWHPSISIAPITGELRPTPLFRISIEPNQGNGLTKPSQIMIDKVQTIPRDKVGQVIGRIDEDTMGAVDQALARWFGLPSA